MSLENKVSAKRIRETLNRLRNKFRKRSQSLPNYTSHITTQWSESMGNRMVTRSLLIMRYPGSPMP